MAFADSKLYALHTHKTHSLSINICIKSFDRLETVLIESNGLPYVYLCAKALNSDRKVSAVVLSWRAIVDVPCYKVTIRDLWAPKMLDLSNERETKHFKTWTTKNIY